jgi:hypothetical protein
MPHFGAQLLWIAKLTLSFLQFFLSSSYPPRLYAFNALVSSFTLRADVMLPSRPFALEPLSSRAELQLPLLKLSLPSIVRRNGEAGRLTERMTRPTPLCFVRRTHPSSSHAIIPELQFPAEIVPGLIYEPS